MTPLALILVFVAAVLHVFRDLLTKTSANKQVFIWWISVLSLLFMFPLALFSALKNPPDYALLFIPLLAGIIHCSYWISYSKAYEEGDLSLVYPIIRSTPLPVLLFSILFLGEKVTTLGVAGVLLVTVGVYLLSISGIEKVPFLSSFSNIFKKRHLRFAFLSLALVTTFTLVDKVGVSHFNPFVYAFVQCSSACFLYSIYIAHTAKSEIRGIWRNSPPKVLLGALVASINYPLFLFAVTLAPVSYVTGVKQIGIVFAVLAGNHLLKESGLVPRLLGAITVCIGIVLISLA